MKRLLNVSLFSLVVFIGVTLFSCNAQVPKADLKTDVDSLSYALGVSSGLDQYLAQSGIDSVYWSDFVKGFQSTINNKKDDKKASAYFMGQQIGNQVATQMVEGMNQNFFSGDSTKSISKSNLVAGILSALSGKAPLISKEESQVYVNTVGEKIRNAAFEKQHVAEKEANAKFLEENKAKEGVVTLPSGLQYKVVTEGTGAKPLATDMVKVDYKGTNIHGEVFDTTEGQEPRQFGLNQVIKGWTEGMQQMPVGSKYILYVPYDLAYGEQGRGEKIGPYATLIFEVTLHEIVKNKDGKN